MPGLGFHGLTLLGGDHIDDPEPGKLRWQDTPDEQDPLAKRKINCHRTSSQDLNAYERAYHNLIYYNEPDKGGHFAAWEQPQLFSEEMRVSFRSLRK